MLDQPGCQHQLPLAHGDGSASDLLCPGSQIGSQPVLLPLNLHHADHAGEAHAAQGDFCNTEHQRSAGKETLRPEVVTGEGASPVPLQIAPALVKVVGGAIDGDAAFHGVLHAGEDVAALQKGDKPEWPHDVSADGGERAEGQFSLRLQPLIPKPQTDAPGREQALSQGHAGPRPPAVDPGGGIGNAPGPLGCDELDGACDLISCGVDCRDQGQAVLVGLALEVPSRKFVIQKKRSSPERFPAKRMPYRGLTDTGQLCVCQARGNVV